MCVSVCVLRDMGCVITGLKTHRNKYFVAVNTPRVINKTWFITQRPINPFAFTHFYDRHASASYFLPSNLFNKHFKEELFTSATTIRINGSRCPALCSQRIDVDLMGLGPCICFNRNRRAQPPKCDG